MIIKAYAKINLTLEIVGKIDNYHLLESVVVPVDIFDVLRFEKASKDEVISNVYIKDNNIYQAIKLFKETFKINECVKVTLDKKIPIGFGMGGSSADISATLNGLNKFFNVNVRIKDLEPLANKLGSDTLFCLYNKRAYIYERGNKIKFLDSDEKLEFMIIYPKANLLTRDVFRAYKNNDKDNYIGFLNKDINFILANLKNDLKEPALSLNKELKALYEKLKENNLNVGLTGSGPALFIVNPTKEESLKVLELLENEINFEFTKEK